MKKKTKKEQKLEFTQSIQWVIDYLTKKGFQKSIDNSGKYYRNGVVYWKKLENGWYLVFYHYNSHRDIYDQGFDPVLMDLEIKDDDFSSAKLNIGRTLNATFNKGRDLELIERLLSGDDVDLSGFHTYRW